MKRAFLFVPIMALAISGCGTINNFREYDVPANSSIFSPGHHPPDKQIYGGVSRDLMFGTALLDEGSTGNPVGLIGIYALLVDLPLSAAADTVTLPVTIPATIRKSREKQQPKRSEESTTEYASEQQAVRDSCSSN